jgi:acyl-homoserine-lactone acylase
MMPGRTGDPRYATRGWQGRRATVVKEGIRLAVIALAASLGACGDSAPAITGLGGNDGGGATAGQIELRRTDYGVIHVKAANYEDLGYGYAYAFAEDNLCVIAESYVTVNGERSKYFGPNASWPFYANTTVNNNLDSDFFFKLLIAEQRVEQLLALLPPNGPLPQVQDLVRGYVAGYNRYLADVGVANLPDPTCRGAAWVRPITEIDVYRRFYELALLASSGVAIEGIGAAQPPPPGKAATMAKLTPLEVATQLGLAWNEIQIGSNAIALGGEATANGRGMILGNPHFPWSGSERFYQAHLTIPGVLDVTGATLFGAPIVVIGHTKGLAWSHTVSSAWRFTPYQLALVPGMPTSYLVDGAPEQMSATPLTVEVVNGDGSLGTVNRTLYSTRWGPVFTSILGLPVFPWTPTVAHALGDVNAANFRFVNHFFEADHAQSTAELHEVLKRNQGVPWVNTIAADQDGFAFYADLSVVPNVPDDKALICAGALGLATFNVLGLPVLDGSRSECGWSVDADAIQPGTIGPSKMPQLFRRDYVTNSNDSHWLANPAQPLEGFMRVIGDERVERRMRTRIGLVMVQEQLAEAPFTRQDLQDLLFNDRQHAAELWLDALIPFCRLLPVIVGTSGPVMTGQACDVLAAWDRTDRLDSPGAPLFRRFGENLSLQTIPTGSSSNMGAFIDVWTVPFDPDDPVHTPAGMNVANPHVQIALADAMADLQGANLPLDATLRMAAFEPRGEEKIPIHGGPGGIGVFNAINNPWVAGQGWPDVQQGSSFIQVVSFDGDDCPDTRTILTYSQSANPASPFFADQTRLYSQGGWVTARYCEEEIAPGLISSRILHR